MKAMFKVSNKLSIELEAKTQKEMFEQLATWEEIFGIEKCGKCESTHIRFVVRTAKKGEKTYSYPELHCEKCRARLAFGTHDNDKGTLFPKRKDESGAYFNHNGWTKYNKETGKNE